jgi:hypothetical protein
MCTLLVEDNHPIAAPCAAAENFNFIKLKGGFVRKRKFINIRKFAVQI